MRIARQRPTTEDSHIRRIEHRLELPLGTKPPWPYGSARGAPCLDVEIALWMVGISEAHVRRARHRFDAPSRIAGVWLDRSSDDALPLKGDVVCRFPSAGEQRHCFAHG